MGGGHNYYHLSPHRSMAVRVHLKRWSVSLENREVRSMAICLNGALDVVLLLLMGLRIGRKSCDSSCFLSQL